MENKKVSNQDNRFKEQHKSTAPQLTEKDEKGRTIDSAKADKPHQAERAKKIDIEEHKPVAKPEAAPKEADPTKCSDCKGEGIRSPNDIRVCPTCEGTGKA